MVGITPVAGQVARARSYARRRGVADRVSFEVQDYTRTTFLDAAFDVVWALESACHASDKRLFLAEARRLLRPGGRLGLAEYVRTGRPYTAADESLLQSWLSGWAIPDLATTDEWLRWVAGTGFQDARVEDITPNARPSLHRLYRMATLLWGAELALRACGLRSEMQHGNARGARDQYRTLQRGLWFYAMLTATASRDGGGRV